MTQAAEARSHAVLSASSSYRWLTCTPSARLEETLADTQSRAAAEGDLAHKIAELKLRKLFVEQMTTKQFNAKLKKLKETVFAGEPLYDDEMLTHTDTYADYVQSIVHGFSSPPFVAVEKRLNYSAWAPDGFGTGDCIVIGGDTLAINDLKYGKGKPVTAVGNTQMRLYALGAYAAFGFLYPIKTIKMAIIQPRNGGITEDEMSIEDLLAWGESIKPIAASAHAGTGEYVPGKHCDFCRASVKCEARIKQFFTAGAAAPAKPPLISWADVGDVLQKAAGIVEWYSALKKAALAEILKGTDIPGWKAVHGRSSREYVDQDAAFKHLQENGIDEALLYVREPITVPVAEKLLKTKQYRELLLDAGHVRVEPGSPTLAPIDDSRPAIDNQVSAEQAFGGGADG